MRSNYLLRLIFAWSTISSCTSPGSEVGVEATLKPLAAEKIALDPPPLSQPAKSLVESECPPSDTVCPMNFAPVMCAAHATESKDPKSDNRLVVWASNNCAGRLKLQKEACARNFPPSKLYKIQCVPDATGGHCPVVEGDCKAGGKPATCVATIYAGEGLSEEQKIAAAASSECQARLELQIAACRENLDPTQLGDIRCQQRKAVK
ncbi:MAG: hypothetical protein RL011_377 [Pseudomonadota bacterium]|jgi:hypothetical protein